MASDPEDREVYCRDCGMPLCRANARTVGNRWAGMCRPCESNANRQRLLRKGAIKGHYDDARRKYPLREQEQST